MSCTKAQIILLVSYIQQLVAKSKSVEEAVREIKKLKARLEEIGVEEIIRDLGI